MAKAKMPAKARPRSRADLMKSVSDLQSMLAVQDDRTRGVEKHRDDLAGQLTAARLETKAANTALQESRGHFADLKERLFNAEMMNNRMQGYIDRVASDDIARDEPVQVGERTLVEVQPRRPRPPFVQPPMGQPDSPSTQFIGRRDQAGESLGARKVGHWTSWG